MGLGTPRETLELVRPADGAPLRMVTTRTRIDHTDAMNRWAEQRVAALALEEPPLCGYVLKKDSPSCGIEYVKTYTPGGESQRDGRGLFATVLMHRFPSLPVEDEGRLSDPRVRDDFIERVFRYHEKITTEQSGPERSQYRAVPVIYVDRAGRLNDDATRDLAAVEEPLEVRLHGEPFAVIMRTPGSDRALAAGFLLSEGVIGGAADIGAVEHCRHPDRPEGHNVVDVYLLGDARASLERHLAARRNVLTTASCGVCGRVAIDALRTRASPLGATWTMSKAVAAKLPATLRERQRVFDGTGGLHAAGIFRPDGSCEVSSEDVGRHNAVDKVIGTLLLEERLPLDGYAIAVSGRTSYEIVQKAWLAGIGLVCAVSAPSSLAIDLAEEAGITLLGFARDGGFNVYTHPVRLPDVAAGVNAR
jgi:FdhD protein